MKGCSRQRFRIYLQKDVSFCMNSPWLIHFPNLVLLMESIHRIEFCRMHFSISLCILHYYFPVKDRKKSLEHESNDFRTARTGCGFVELHNFNFLIFFSLKIVWMSSISSQNASIRIVAPVQYSSRFEKLKCTDRRNSNELR